MALANNPELNAIRSENEISLARDNNADSDSAANVKGECGMNEVAVEKFSKQTLLSFQPKVSNLI